MRDVVVTLVTAATLAACAGDAIIPIPDECNGSIELCSRRYDQVAYPTTHNAMSNEADGWVYPNQYFGIGQQLEDGVRGLMLDTYDLYGTPELCHAFCQAGMRPLVDGLTTIRKFLDTHRGEVVTIIFESYITADETAGAFENSGLIKYVHAQDPGTPWPTLREMIDADERMVVFTDDGGGQLDWYMDVWAHAWETPYHYEDISEFTCAMNRGVAGNPLFIFNHFLTQAYAVPEQAPVVNADPLLVDRAMQCMQESGRMPNFITLDFYSVGSLFEATRTLNGL
jgi:hypothetical protein